MAAIELSSFDRLAQGKEEDMVSSFSAGRSSSSGLSLPFGAVRVLNPALDRHVISHVVACGTRTYRASGGRATSTADQAMWSFEKDGIVVLASAAPDIGSDMASWVGSSLQLAFCMEASLQDARDAYAALVENIDSAIDEDDRLDRLRRAWHGESQPGSVSRIFHGVDLGTRPVNKPLLLYCAGEGFAKCLQELIASGFPVDVVGSNKCNALHSAAWGGHTECVKILCQTLPELAEQANKWLEFPEQAAYDRACEHDMLGEVCPERFYQAAEMCLRSRKGGAELDRNWFQDEAAKRLQHDFKDSVQVVTIASGTRPQDIIAAASQVTREWSMQTLQAKAVDLRSDEVLRHLLRAATQGRFLQVLRLEGCGVGRDGAAAVREFLQCRQVPLSKLDLTGNRLGDNIKQLLCTPLFQVKSFTVADAGLADADVRSIAEKFSEAIDEQRAKMETLQLGRNDLSSSEAVTGNGGLGALLRVLSQKGCPLRQLFLDHTRLLRHQLEALVDELPATTLTKLSCHGLGIPPDWAAQGGKLYKALHNQSCSVKRLEVDQGSGSDMFDKLWRAIKRRDSGLSETSASVWSGKGKGKGSVHDNVQTACADDGRSFSFRTPFAAHLRAVYWDYRRSAWKGNFVTEAAGVVTGVLLPTHEDSPEAELQVNESYWITLKRQPAPEGVNKDGKAKDLIVDGLEKNSAAGLRFLAFCRLVLIRGSTREVLLLTARLSPSANQLKNIIVQEHFSQLASLPQEMQQQLRSLVRRLWDCELHALVDSTGAESLLPPWGNSGGKFIDDVARVQHNTLVCSAAWRALLDMAKAEKSHRQTCDPSQEQAYRMLTYMPPCQPQSGASMSGRMSLHDPVNAFIEELNRNALRGAGVQIVAPPQPDEKMDTDVGVYDCSGRVFQRFLFCVVAEDLLDPDDPGAPLPCLPFSCWVSASHPDQMSKLLHDDATEGFPDLAESICKIAATGNPDGMMRCIRQQAG